MGVKTLNKYQRAALRTANTECRNLVNCALGLTGESGEFADLLKKHTFQGHELHTEELKKELGDILWYVAVAAEVLGCTLEEVANSNVEKLLKRYPNGFEAVRSVEREEFK